MFRSWLAAAAVTMMMAGAAFAQTASSSATAPSQSKGSVSAPLAGTPSTSSSKQTPDSNGVVTDKTQTYANGTKSFDSQLMS
jgi:hypothetical protein